MPRKLTGIVAMDMVGFSLQMERDEPGALGRLKEIRAHVVDPAVARHVGRTVKLMGDGGLLEFPSVVDALQCAIEIQRELGARNAAAPEVHRLSLRIGVHLGDVIVDGEDIYGDGVNVAARLESIAPPGGIILSKQAYDQIGGKCGLGSSRSANRRSRTSRARSRHIASISPPWTRPVRCASATTSSTPRFSSSAVLGSASPSSPRSSTWWRSSPGTPAGR